MDSAARRIRQIGKLGEGVLDRLCNLAELTVTPPFSDENGWDRFVEFPQNRLPGVFMDAQPSPLKCLVQVKATDDLKNNPVRMKVSNFEHLARSTLPTFVFICDFAGMDDPTSAYLVHFNEFWIGKTLEKVRELEAAGERELHRDRMLFRAEETDLISALNGKSFKDRILQHTGTDAARYALSKINSIDSVGTEEMPYKISVRLRSDPASLSRMLLGLQEMDIEGGLITHRRFGIELPEHKIEAGGSISIIPSVAGKCQLRAESETLPRSVRTEAAVKLPPVADLPPELFRILVENENLKIELYRGGGTMSFEARDGEHRDLDALIADLDFTIACAGPNTDLVFLKDEVEFARSTMPALQIPKSYSDTLYTLRLVRKYLDKINVRSSFLIDISEYGSRLDELRWMEMVCSRPSMTLSKKYTRGTFERDIDAHGTFSRPIIVRKKGGSFIALNYWDAHISIKGDALKAKLSNHQVWDTVEIHDDDPIEPIKSRLSAFESFGQNRAGKVLIYTSVEFTDRSDDTGSAVSQPQSTVSAKTPSSLSALRRSVALRALRTR